MHILNAADTAYALPYRKLVPAIAQAAGELRSGRIHAPERLVVTIDPASVLLCMPAIADDVGVTKLITVHNDNVRYGLPAIQGEVTVFETKNGRRLALLDGPTVTARRTAAVSMLGIDCLALRPPKSAVLIGTGVQAAAHAEALIEYAGVGEVHIAGRDAAKVEACCASLRSRYADARVEAVAMERLPQSCENADVVIALTTSRSPVVPEHLPDGTLAIGVGAFKPDMAELPSGLLQARAIVVDHLAGARHEAGDLMQAGIDWSRVQELGGALSGRRDEKEKTAPVLKTVGHAAWDLAAARVAIQTLL